MMNSIYLATEGEGVHLGTPQVFVRFQGCNIGCLNCDSKDTWEFEDRLGLSMDEILVQIHEKSNSGRIRRVSITGGDPLHPKNVPAVSKLARELKARRYFVNIEASGTRLVHEVFDSIDFISFDFKTPSTGVETPLESVKKLSEQYEGRFQIKSVIENEKDFDYVLGAAEKLGEFSFPWVLTPAFNLGELLPFERFNKIIKWNEKSGGLFRVIIQQHKVIHGADKKQV
ncbi:MAG: 7-carboxy-7-deazaguanine synthase QueE [Bacteriovoracaceae bacterium]|nr:7-carboxy-7-deazaguanine synthase QueE [Bacteriovoracaceae bacterium]